jgi:hypothetical protein
MHTEKAEVVKYNCRHCQAELPDVPLSFGADAPIAWEGLPVTERARRATLGNDLCEIDGQHFFIRGRIELPIRGSGQVFTWLVWSSLSAAHFHRVQELWQSVGRENEPPYFGWLNSALPSYPSTINLKVLVHTSKVGERPLVELEPTDHALSVEQREGITWARVHELLNAVGQHGA